MTSKLSKTTKRARAKLSRSAILDAALAIVRQDGLDALTMRRVASDLEAGPMSLYRHVKDRDDLLLGMMDHVATCIPLPKQQSDDREEIVEIILTIHTAFRSDPWLVHVLLFEGRGSLNVLPLFERLYAAMGRLGCGPAKSIDYYSMLLHYAYGESLSFQTRDKRREIQTEWAEDAFEAYPATSKVMEVAWSWKYDEFERNLRRLVATI